MSSQIGKIVWMEIPAVDVESCASFYRNLFPAWDFKPATEQYPAERIAMFESSKGGISGGITKVSDLCKSTELKHGMGVTVYHSVESVEETKKQVEALGGKAVSEKMPEGENGWFMYFLDTEGNRFGVYELKKMCQSKAEA